MKQITLRPHDVAVALQLVISPQRTYASLSSALWISASEVHQSVSRLRIAKLLGTGASRKARRRSVEEFIICGVRYAFPAELGSAVRGVPTALSGPQLRAHFGSRAAGTTSVESVFVWAHEHGEVRGTSVTPLYAGAPGTVKNNPALYNLLTLVDALRIGQARERQLAKTMLSHALNVDYS